MPSIGPLELLIVGVVALVVFGPQRLPEIARTVGKAMAELRRMASEVRSEFEEGLSVDDPPPDRWVAEKPTASEGSTEAVAPEADSSPPTVPPASPGEED